MATNSSPGPPQYWTPRRAALATIVVTAVTGGILLICRFYHIVIVLLLAIVLATALKPMVAWLTGRGVRWPFAVGAIFAGFAVVMFAAVMLGGPAMVGQASDFLTALPEQYDRLIGQMSDSRITFLRSVAELMPSDLGELNPEAGASKERPPIQPIILVMHGAFQVALTAALLCLLSAYWLLQEQRTLQALLLVFPRERRDEVRTLIATVDEKLGAYVRGQFVLCLIVGLLSFLGYWLIGLPQAGLLGLVAGLLEAVPMIGPLLGAVPALLVALGSDPTKVIGVVVLTLVIQQLENYLLVPRVMDRAVGIHGFVTLLAIAAFGTLFGLLGAVLAIPLAVIVQVVVERYVLGHEVLEPEQPAGRDRASRMRFELQSLVKDVRMVIRHKPNAVKEGNDLIEEAIEALAADLDRSLAIDDDPPTEDEKSVGVETCAATS